MIVTDYILGEPLLPCPFCGSHALWFEDERLAAPNYQPQLVYGIKCSKEGCILDSRAKYFRTEIAAGMAWNTRVNDEVGKEICG